MEFFTVVATNALEQPYHRILLQRPNKVMKTTCDGAKTVIKQFFGNYEEIKACNLIPL